MIIVIIKESRKSCFDLDDRLDVVTSVAPFCMLRQQFNASAIDDTLLEVHAGDL